jgi:hypothetical protein
MILCCHTSEDGFWMGAIEMDFLGCKKQTTMLGLTVEWRFREREVGPVVVVDGHLQIIFDVDTPIDETYVVV